MWKTMKLGDICEFRQGIQVGKNLQKEQPEEKSNVRFLRIVDFTQNNEPPRYIDFPGEKYLVKKKDVSLVRYGNPGFVCRGIEGAIANNLFRVIPKTNELHNNFLYWFLKSPFFQKKIGASKTGVAMQTISFGIIKDIEIKLPPLAEQQRIVAKLDAAFAEIDGMIKGTEKNLECVKQLFEKRLSQVFSSAKKNWQAGKITDFCSIKSGTTVDKKLEVAVGDIAYLKVADMNLAENKSGVITSSRFLNYSDVRKTQIIEAGSIIFPKRGGAILTNKKRITSVPICADLNIMSVVSNGAMQPKLLFYYFLNIDMRQLGSGSSIPQINNYDIEPLSISFPTNSDEQCRLIAQLDEMYVQKNNLLDVCKKKIIEFTNLKSAILAQELQSEAA